jgi:uncharacterized protein
MGSVKMTEYVVSNTSPLTNLAAIGHLELLPSLFDRIEIADAVWNELQAGGQSWSGRDELAEAPWVARHRPDNRSLIRALQRDLDAGESESIALALELGGALILLDEKEGRRMAQHQGLKPMGIVGVLLLAKGGLCLPGRVLSDRRIEAYIGPGRTSCILRPSL